MGGSSALLAILGVSRQESGSDIYKGAMLGWDLLGIYRAPGFTI
jgi:hypothetical protein